MPRQKVWVILVANHKTAKHGPARITLSDDMKTKVDIYVTMIRCVCDPFDDASLST